MLSPILAATPDQNSKYLVLCKIRRITESCPAHLFCGYQVHDQNHHSQLTAKPEEDPGLFHHPCQNSESVAHIFQETVNRDSKTSRQKTMNWLKHLTHTFLCPRIIPHVTSRTAKVTLQENRRQTLYNGKDSVRQRVVLGYSTADTLFFFNAIATQGPTT